MPCCTPDHVVTLARAGCLVTPHSQTTVEAEVKALSSKLQHLHHHMEHQVTGAWRVAVVAWYLGSPTDQLYAMLPRRCVCVQCVMYTHSHSRQHHAHLEEDAAKGGRKPAAH